MFRKIALAGCILAAGLGLGVLQSAPARAADDVRVQLDWVVRGDHAMFFVARDKGYFEQNGIHITDIHKGSGTPDALRLTANGDADFGFGDLPSLAVARSQGLPVVALVAVNQYTPLAMIALAKSHKLNTPADLKGLNIGIHPAGSTYIFFKALLAANGMSESDVKESSVSPPYENYLLLGRVDAVPGYVDAEVPELEAKAGGKGSLSIMLGSKFGYDIYGSGLFTSEKMVKEKPDLVKRFVAAYVKAFNDVVADPKAAVAMVVKDNPEYSGKEDVLLAQLQADIESTFSSDETKAHGLGAMSKEEWSKTLTVLQQQGALKAPVEVGSVYDASFLP
jgi:NitT/TauT family transport system substrate-binding protein